MGRRVVLAAAALIVLTCAYTWPLVLHARSAVAHDRGDPLLVTWILWWSTHTVPLTAAWWNAPAFYPSTGVFAFSESLLGLAPIAWPVIALTKSPLLAYNVTFLLSYVLSGLGAYFLGFVLTRRHGAALVAAIAFAFAPYRLSHQHHLQLLSSYWMPAAVAALHLYVESPRPRWAILFAASWLLQALACGYYFFYLTLFAGLWLAWFAPRRLTPRTAGVLAAAWLAAGLLVAPLLLGYRSIQSSYGFKRSPVEIVNYSADVAGLWSAAPDSLAWRWLHGRAVPSESEQFPGVTAALLLVAAAVGAKGANGAKGARGAGAGGAEGAEGAEGLSTEAQSANVDLSAGARSAKADARHAMRFYVAAAVVMWILSLGPEIKLHGASLGIPGPYAVLASLPGFDGMRVPARLWMVTVLCLAACGALAIARVESRKARAWLVAVATLGLLIDGWPRALAMFPVPGMRTTSSTASARLGLPMRFSETETMYGAIEQDRPVFNGYSGYAAPQHAALLDLLEHYDPRILARVAATEPVEVIVERSGDPDGSWSGYVRRQAGARLIREDPDWTSYEIAPSGFAAPPPIDGERVKVASIAASANQHDIGAVLDGDLDSRWHVPRQSGGETITMQLERAQAVRAVVMCLGAYPGQYPRQLAIDVSPDGAAWTTVHTGGTALETYDAALIAPREVPVTIPAATNVRRDNVRFIRLRQTGTDAHGWSIVELRVLN